MDDEAASPLPVNERMLCPRCRYDFRGTASPVCPECGAAKICTKLAFFNNDEFNEAARVLKEADVYFWRVHSSDGGTGVINFFTGQTKRPEIWFGLQDAKKVFALLDETGVATPLPIVDRSEPDCPSCNAPLDTKGDEICPACGVFFQWVDIDELPEDET